jgi:hypothetical protein
MLPALQIDLLGRGTAARTQQGEATADGGDYLSVSLAAQKG